MVFGSSPLARGLRAVTGGVVPAVRIIPARAGFTPRKRCQATGTEDHPRSRGVYQRGYAGDVLLTGSSPLARGLQHRPEDGRTDTRIIPARAGFTSSWRTQRGLISDHPRSRGVYMSFVPVPIVQLGSSPLARGLRSRRPRRRRDPGIIPARAGVTIDPRRSLELVEDHPRSRGVYFLLRRAKAAARGSSPLARGLRPGRPGWQVPGRIIPARAGFTQRVGDLRRAVADHPRSRGVYGREWIEPYDARGSSPLARGLLSVNLRLSRLRRIIPARAGFTRRSTGY